MSKTFESIHQSATAKQTSSGAHVIGDAAAGKTASGEAMVRVTSLRKEYGDFVALNDVSLDIAKGEFVTLLGPSGSGKSTLLNLIAGMTIPDSGKIFIDGKDATSLPTNKRGLGMVFQNYALMPHMTVFENIAFPLQVRGIAKQEIKERVQKVLKLIQLEKVSDRKPKALSGGQQQRISLARCLVYNPPIILMDEPLGALDKQLREDMQLEIKRLHAELGITMLYVTHDQDEALTMSDRIVLMRGGAIEQQGTPDALYFEPDTVFTAGFIGTSNLISGMLRADGAGMMLESASGKLPVRIGENGLKIGDSASILIRPENLRLKSISDATDPAEAEVAAQVEDSILLGGVVRHFLRTKAGETLVVQELNQPGRPKLARGTAMRVCWRAADSRLLPSSGNNAK
jgi:putative spermidine/putrescine transport system ATP-binding protein